MQVSAMHLLLPFDLQALRETQPSHISSSTAKATLPLHQHSIVHVAILTVLGREPEVHVHMSPAV